jgi:hypothetical protein
MNALKQFICNVKTKKVDISSFLSYHIKKKAIHSGLTIPYLLGSHRLLNPNVTINILDFVGLICLDSKLYLQKCVNIGDLVIGVIDIESEKQYANTSVKRISKLYILDSSCKCIDTVEQLADYLYETYQSPIDEGRFSKENGSWRLFSESEIKFIYDFKREVSSR